MHDTCNPGWQMKSWPQIHPDNTNSLCEIRNESAWIRGQQNSPQQRHLADSLKSARLEPVEVDS